MAEPGLSTFNRASVFLLTPLTLLVLICVGPSVHAQSFVYVAMQNGSVSIIDTTTKEVSTVPVGGELIGVAFTPDGAFAWVTQQSRIEGVSVIDTSTNTVVRTISLGPNAAPRGIAITPDGRFAYVVEHTSGTVAVVDTESYEVVKTVTVGSADRGFSFVAITPDGAFAYVTAEGGPYTVSVINTDSYAVTQVQGYTGEPAELWGIAITPDGRFAYVAHPFSSLEIVSKIDIATNTVVKTVSIPGHNPHQVAITPDGSFAYVTYGCCSFAQTPAGVAVIRTADDTVVADIRVGVIGNAFGVAVSPDGAFAYVAVSETSEIVVVDTDPMSASYNTIVARVPVSCCPWGLAVTPY